MVALNYLAAAIAISLHVAATQDVGRPKRITTRETHSLNCNSAAAIWNLEAPSISQGIKVTAS